MKIVILAGGHGSRLAENSKSIPKPMVKIGGKPILMHIIERYEKFGFNEFVIALGYKSNFIINYFTKIALIKKKEKSYVSILININKTKKIKLDLIYTGINTMTGGRIKKIKKFVNNETFMVTYGDGLSNINFKTLLKYHKSHGKIGTVSTVHPLARFGEILLKNNYVVSFKEKPQTATDWINGGFFVFEPIFFDYIKSSSTVLEEQPLENLSKDRQLKAFKHEGFWQSMDSKRDKDILEKLVKKRNYPWK